MTEQPDNWTEKQKILVILAHPDDPEFFCGGTLLRWTQAGHEVNYVLLTCGDKGRNDQNKHIPGEELCALRHIEQRNAADVLGVNTIQFMGLPDGYLTPSLDLRRDVVRLIRQFKPDVIVTCDPQNLFAIYGLNHPDHRAAGQVVLDAIFPAAGNELFFPELLAEGHTPHAPKEVWVSLTNQPNVIIDITEHFESKFRAICQHQSQLGDPAALEKRMRSRHTEDSTLENPRYEEKFRVVSWR